MEDSNNKDWQSLLNAKKDEALGQECNIDLLDRGELARYFAKHLGCALDYQKFPIPRRLSRFVGRKRSKVCISVSTRMAPFWWQSATGEIGPINSLGGAILKMRFGILRIPGVYQSAYTTNGQQFIVRMKLNWIEALEMRLFYLRNMGKFMDAFDNDEAKYRGLPYDEE